MKRKGKQSEGMAHENAKEKAGMTWKKLTTKHTKETKLQTSAF
jgi:hypothetical protein